MNETLNHIYNLRFLFTVKSKQVNFSQLLNTVVVVAIKLHSQTWMIGSKSNKIKYAFARATNKERTLRYIEIEM